MSNKVYLTNEGFLEIEEELNYLRDVKRPEIIKALKDARALGDLSENADYDAAIYRSRETLDPTERSKALHDAEDILMEETGCIPVAYYNDFWLQSDKITGSWHSPYGYWYFMYADITE